MAPAKIGKVRRTSTTTKLYLQLLERDKVLATWICGFIFFKQDMGADKIREIVTERLLAIPRFCARAKLPKGFINIPVEEMDMDYHIKINEEALTVQEVQDTYAGNVMASWPEFDKNKPLWRLMYFPKLADGRSMLLTNFAHAIGDGVSLVEVLFRLLDPRDAAAKGSGGMGMLDKQPSMTEGDAPTAAAAAAIADKDGNGRPPPKRKGAISTFGPLNKSLIFVKGIFAGMTTAFGTNDSPNSLMRKNMKIPSTVKSTSFSEDVPLSKIKEIKDKYQGATINDILMTVLTLTLIAHLKSTTGNERILRGKGKIRAGFPISNRRGAGPFNKDGSPHNSLALGAVRFPMKFKSRPELVYRIKRSLDAVKLSPEPIVQNAISNVGIQILPRIVTSTLMQHMHDQCTALLSNVAGPQKAVHMGGLEVDDLRFLVSSSMGAYLGLLSYNGNVSLGVNLDASLGKAEDISQHWKASFDSLYEDTMAYDGMVPRSGGRALDCL